MKKQTFKGQISNQQANKPAPTSKMQKDLGIPANKPYVEFNSDGLSPQMKKNPELK